MFKATVLADNLLDIRVLGWCEKLPFVKLPFKTTFQKQQLLHHVFYGTFFQVHV